MSNLYNFDFVIYHKNCSDGISSSWVTTLVNKTAQQIPCIAGKDPLVEIEIFREKTVLFCDICPTAEYLQQLLDLSANVIVIDHHKDSLNCIEKYCIICDRLTIIRSSEMRKSGCILTWEYFFQNKEIPWFLRYIADRDTWSWALPNSKEINSALFEDKHISYEGLTKLDSGETTMKQLIVRGKIILEIKNQIIEKFVNSAIACKYKYYNIWLYNCLGEYRSDVGNYLLNKEILLESGIKVSPDFTVSWHFNFPHEYWLSLRSDDSRVDVCEIAKEIAENGGGHRNAAGVTIDHSKFIDIFRK